MDFSTQAPYVARRKLLNSISDAATSVGRRKKGGAPASREAPNTRTESSRMPLVTFEERMTRPRGCTIAVVASPGTGKTFQSRFLHGHEGCLFLDMEAGTLAVDHDIVSQIDGSVIPAFRGPVITGIRSWEYAQALITLVGGPDPSRSDKETYSVAAYERARREFPREAVAIEACHTIFLDSYTYLSRVCYDWACKQPQATTSKGAFDQWGVYRLLADEMVRATKHLQQRTDKRIVVAMILDRSKDGSFEYQLHGQKTADELYGVFDTVAALVECVQVDGGIALAHGANPQLPRFRAFVCNKPNPWNLPVKDRSSRLSMLEPPDLGALIAKITTPNARIA